jgi:predicted ATPase
MHQLSEGSLRFLWLAALLQSRAIAPITLLDEPEISFHPELQQVLVELMREASKRTRLIVTTHSDRLVRFLKPTELVVVDTEDGVTRFTSADKLDIDEWLTDYGLDDLWRNGRLGARS